MATEKKNFSWNAEHNFAKGRVIFKCKNDKLNRKSVSPPHSPFFKEIMINLEKIK